MKKTEYIKEIAERLLIARNIAPAAAVNYAVEFADLLESRGVVEFAGTQNKLHNALGHAHDFANELEEKGYFDTEHKPNPEFTNAINEASLELTKQKVAELSGSASVEKEIPCRPATMDKRPEYGQRIETMTESESWMGTYLFKSNTLFTKAGTILGTWEEFVKFNWKWRPVMEPKQEPAPEETENPWRPIAKDQFPREDQEIKIRFWVPENPTCRIRRAYFSNKRICGLSGGFWDWNDAAKNGWEWRPAQDESHESAPN